MAKKTAKTRKARKNVAKRKVGMATGRRKSAPGRKKAPAKKRAPAKKAAGKRTTSRTATVLRATTRIVVSPRRRGLAAATKTVTFSCSSPLCQVSLQVGSESTTFVGSGQMSLPPGFHQMTMQVQGPGGTPFTLTASGAQMQPVNGVASVAGLIPITV